MGLAVAMVAFGVDLTARDAACKERERKKEMNGKEEEKERNIMIDNLLIQLFYLFSCVDNFLGKYISTCTDIGLY